MKIFTHELGGKHDFGDSTEEVTTLLHTTMCEFVEAHRSMPLIFYAVPKWALKTKDKTRKQVFAFPVYEPDKVEDRLQVAAMFGVVFDFIRNSELIGEIELFGVSAEAWMSTVPLEDAEGNMVMPSKDPNRIEVIMTGSIDEEGEMATRAAQIVRAVPSPMNLQGDIFFREIDEMNSLKNKDRQSEMEFGLAAAMWRGYLSKDIAKELEINQEEMEKTLGFTLKDYPQEAINALLSSGVSFLYKQLKDVIRKHKGED